MMALKAFFAAALIAAPIISPPVSAQEYVETGRYTKVVNDADAAQKNLLRVVVQTEIPKEVGTVGAAMEFLLSRSGYQLADQSVLSREAKILLTHPLPYVHRSIGPMTLDEALRALAGDAYELLVDPVHRRVGFVLSESVRGQMNG